MKNTVGSILDTTLDINSTWPSVNTSDPPPNFWFHGLFSATVPPKEDNLTTHAQNVLLWRVAPATWHIFLSVRVLWTEILFWTLSCWNRRSNRHIAGLRTAGGCFWELEWQGFKSGWTRGAGGSAQVMAGSKRIESRQQDENLRRWGVQSRG